MVLQGNAVIAQSGGPTAVINNSVCGAVQEWLRRSAPGALYAGIGGVKGILEGKLLDLTAQEPRVIEGLRYTPGAA
ncbi:MAG: 6-phosphofructokinase, partial [Clostridiales bacterium]|nr:6-phosphofructokinase [Clostridiales bacterium]